MNRMISVVLAVAMLLSMVPVLSITTYAATSGDFEYSVYDGKVTITDYTGDSSTVQIPSSLDGYPVTAIGGYAFSSCSSLYRINIPDGVTSIGAYAFSDCFNLTQISIPDSIRTIGKSAFRNCFDLHYHSYDNAKYLGNDSNPYVALIKGVKETITSCDIHLNTAVIASEAFLDHTSLTEVNIPDGVFTIGNAAFRNCTSLSGINIPDSVTRIGEFAFYQCSSMTSVIIGNGVTAIGQRAFVNCSELRKVILGHSLTSIGEYAFSGCTRLSSISIPDSVRGFGQYAFKGCTRLTGIVIPDGVTGISDGVFSGCLGLDSIVLPDGVTGIGQFAFSGVGLDDITIPVSVIYIGKGAFSGRVNDVWYSGSLEQRRQITIYRDNDGLSAAVWHYNICASEAHLYGKVCDTQCDVCGYRRQAAAHTYDSVCHTVCNICNEVRTVEHVFDNACDAQCNVCGYERQVPDHTYSSTCDTQCNVCGYGRQAADHTYDSVCDTVCDLCDAVRTVDHVFDQVCDAYCNVCGYEREAAEHSYSSICDTQCNVCGYGRQAVDHTYDSVCDTFCDLCGAVRTVDHVFDNACDAQCNVCDHKRQPAEHIYSSVCDTTCDECSEKRTAPHVFDSVCDDQCNVCDKYRTPSHNYTNDCDGECNSCGKTRSITHKFKGSNCTVCRKPLAPTVESKSDNSVTLTSIASYQYSMDGQTWQDSPVFTGLKPGTEYQFYQRLVDSTIYYVSPASDPLTVTTERAEQEAPEAPTLESRTDTEVRLTYIPGYEYSMDGKNWQGYIFINLRHSTQYTFYQRKAQNTSHNASPASPGLQVTTVKRTAVVKCIINQDTGEYCTYYKLEDTPLRVMTPSRAGYRFRGWSLTPYSGEPVYSWYTHHEEKGITLYAVWGKICDDCDVSGFQWACSICKGVGSLKLPQLVTDTPELVACTSWSVTLRQYDGMEYSLDGISWQASPVFTDLQPATEYQFYQRYAENEYRTPATSLCPPLTVTTKLARLKPDAPAVFSCTDTTVILVRVEGCEYSLDGESWQTSNIFTDLQPATQYTFYQRYAAEGDYSCSAPSNGFVVTTAAPSVPPHPTGDVTGDEKVNMKDWIALYGHINEINILTGDALKRADVNGDGKVNMKDWSRLYEHISEINPL